MVWQKKKIVANKTLGERLREIREEYQYQPEDVEKAIGISRNYVEFLESGLYEKLPGEVYVRSFLKKYAAFLKINESKVIKLYEEERRIVQGLGKRDTNKYFSPKEKVNFTLFTPKFFRNVVIAVLVIGVLAYLGWELTHVVAPPKLEIIYPPDKFVTSEKNLEIKGRTEPESKVLVNGKEVYVDSEGDFREEIILKEGVNFIKVSSYKKQGKESTLQREILYNIK